MRPFGDLTVLSGGTMDMADKFLEIFEGTTFTNNGAVINSVRSFGEVDFNGVGGAQARRSTWPAPAPTTPTDESISIAANSTAVVPASGTVLNGLTNWTIDGGSTISLTNDFVVNGLTGVGQATAFANGGTISGTGIMKAHNNVAISGGGTIERAFRSGRRNDDCRTTTLGAVTVERGATLVEAGTMRPFGDTDGIERRHYGYGRQFFRF